MGHWEVSAKSREVEQSGSTGTDHQEIEWQFDGAHLASIAGWLEEGHEGLGIFVEPGEEKVLTDVYHDTADWRLYRAGYALRIRALGPRRSEATMKSLASDAGGDNVRRRREISEPLGGEEPSALLNKKSPGPVGERLKALVGSRELHPLFEVHTRRHTFNLFEVQTGGLGGTSERQDNGPLGEIVQNTAGNIRRDGGGSRIGEAALDETKIPHGDEPVCFARVEVEAAVSGAGASLELLKEFAETMEEEFGLRPATASKYELGLLTKGLDPERDLATGPTSTKKKHKEKPFRG